MARLVLAVAVERRDALELGRRAHVAVRDRAAQRGEVVRARDVGALDLLAHDERVVRTGDRRLERLLAPAPLVVLAEHLLELGVVDARGGARDLADVDADRGGRVELVADLGAAARLVGEVGVALRREPVLAGGEREGAQPLERAALGEREHAVEVAGVERFGVDALEALEAQERAAVDVAAGEVARRLEAVGVVVDVRAQHRDDLEHVLGRPVARVGGLRRGAAERAERERDRRAESRVGPPHRPAAYPKRCRFRAPVSRGGITTNEGRFGPPAQALARPRPARPDRRGRSAIAFSIFSVAITAAASWSESTPSVEKDPSGSSSERQVITVSTSAAVLPPGGIRTRKSVRRGTSSFSVRAALRSAFMKAS